MKYKRNVLTVIILFLIFSNIVLIYTNNDKIQLIKSYSNKLFNYGQFIYFQINNVNSLLIEDVHKMIKESDLPESNKLYIFISEGDCMSCIYDFFELIKLNYGNEDNRILVLTSYRNEQRIKTWMNALIY